jgi:hypothetical protein
MATSLGNPGSCDRDRPEHWSLPVRHNSLPPAILTQPGKPGRGSPLSAGDAT